MDEIFSFGTWVRRRRKALDLTQAALAQRVGCAEVTIRKLETDVFRPSRELAERLATYLDLPTEQHAIFLQVARGERSVDRLPTPQLPIEPTRPVPAATPLPVATPLDTVPDPAPLPAGSRMPLSRNPLFVGRADDLRQITSALQVGNTAAIGQVEIAAATGLGGIGKTQLACEFVHCYGQFFPGGVFWLSFADSAAVPAEVAACGGADGMHLSPTFSMLPLGEQVKLVLAAWESPSVRLLVFDNCEDEALLDQWRPKHGGCRVLVTSRRHHWDATLGVQALPLDVLTRPDSLVLLRTFCPEVVADHAALDAIAEALGDLPLALHLAGSFLAKYRHASTPAQYLQRLRAPSILDDRSLRAAGLSPTQHVQHVARTFEQSYARLDPGDPTDALARRLLAHAACLAPGESVPRWLLRETLELPEEDVEPRCRRIPWFIIPWFILWSLIIQCSRSLYHRCQRVARLICARGPQTAEVEAPLVVDDAVTRLIDLGLLETDTAGDLRLHRLLVAFVRAVLEHETAQMLIEATVLRVANDVNTTRNPRPSLAVQPHLRFITAVARPRMDVQAAGLCHALGLHLWLLGVYAAAQDYLEQAVTIRQQILGLHHPHTAESLHHLGTVLWSNGQYAAAQDYLEQAVTIRQQILGAHHPHTAESLNNKGVVHKAQGQYAAAYQHFEQAVTIWQDVLGPVHPHTAKGLHNLGSVLEVHGEYAAAQDYYEQAVAIRQQVLTPNHPDIAYSLHSLGTVLGAQGHYEDGQGYLEQALAIRVQMLGDDHPLTAESVRGLGTLLHTQGNVRWAQHYLERAFTIYKHRLGKDHPETHRTRRMLAILETSATVEPVS